MISNLITIFSQAKEDLNNSKDIDSLELIKTRYLGKKGVITQQVKMLKNLESGIKPKFGLILNRVKQELEDLFLKKKRK